MLQRLAILAAVCTLAPVGAAPLASAEPPPPPIPGVQPVANPGPPPDTGVVASSPPSIVTTPDGWELTVAATNETQLAVAPLTTALSSREYLVGATFTGNVGGSGSTELDGGTLVTGYQIGCGIALDKVELEGGIDIGTDVFSAEDGLFPSPEVGIGIGGSVNVVLVPGEVEQIDVIEKEFSGTTTRVTVKDVHISVDGCVGQSFLRSFAMLTSSTADTDDIVVYYGVTKAV